MHGNARNMKFDKKTRGSIQIRRYLKTRKKCRLNHATPFPTVRNDGLVTLSDKNPIVCQLCLLVIS